MLFHPAQVAHASSVDRGSELVIVHIDLETTLAFCGLYGNVTRNIHLPFEVLRGVPDRIREELTHCDDAAPVILESLAMQMMALGSRTVSSGPHVPPPWLPRALSHIRDAITTPLTTRSIAAVVGVSPSRFSHVFRAVMRRSVSTYIRESRVRLAASALRNSDESISQIALNCGFYDQAHLTRAFKALRGMTPLRYRRASRSRPKPIGS
jgi:AraC family transcriptional regulator